MKNLILNLRKQPEDVRTHILHVMTVGASVILVLLWVYSLGTNIANPDNQALAKQNLQPFSVLKDNLVGGYQSLSQPTLTTPSSSTDDQQIDTSVLNQ